MFDTFQELWAKGTRLACPKLKGHPLNGDWLHNGNDDPCKSGDCNFRTCHNYKEGFDQSQLNQLITPKSFPHHVSTSSEFALQRKETQP